MRIAILLIALTLNAAEPEHVPGDGGRALDAFLNFPESVVLDAAGNIYISERGGNRVRRIDAKSGMITTVAGTGEEGYGGDGGPAKDAKLSQPTALAVDRAGNLYIGDTWNWRIRRVDAKSGMITTYAGTGEAGFDGDGGPATKAKMSAPFGMAFDAGENLYFADTEIHRIRRIDRRTGVITTVAGNGIWDFGGDGGPATEASLARPHRLAIDARGHLIIGDSFNQRIRRVDLRTGIIETIAGTGLRGSSGDGGPAKDATFCYFGDLLFDARGDLLVSGVCDSRIRKIDMRTGIITNVAASFETPVGLARGRDGIYVVDMHAHRVLRLDVKTNTVVTIAGGKTPRNPVITWRFNYKREEFVRDVSGPAPLALPGTDAVTVRQDIRYAGDALRRFDLYRARDGQLPVVVLVSGRNDTEVLPDTWGLFESRARLFAASGFATVMFNHRLGLNGSIVRGAEDLGVLLQYLDAHANELGLDTSRIALVAYSMGSVALPAVMRAPPAGVKAIVAFAPDADLRELQAWQAPGKTAENAARYSMVTNVTGATPRMLLIREAKDAPVVKGAEVIDGVENAATIQRAIDFVRGALVAPEPRPFLNINPSWSPDGKQLVFQSERTGVTQLYVVNANGTGERRLTWNAGHDTHPAWSPDGQTIVFDSARDGSWELYTIKPDGTGERRLTHRGTASATMFARHPSWSPDGKRIVFDSDRDGDEEIYLMDAGGTNVKRLTNAPGRDGHASFTPDGRELLFTAARDGNQDAWIMNADGTSPRRLTDHPTDDGSPKMSPDGTRIAFYSERDGNTEIYSMDRQGKIYGSLTADPHTVYELAWSPDGKQIAYYTDAPGRFELFVMDADGGNKRQVTHTGYDNAWPQWSPDGKSIVFASTRDEDWEIYGMSADGTGAKRLTHSPGRDAHPAFTPDGARIVFQSPRDYTEPGEVDLYRMNTDGTQQRRLLIAPGFDGVTVPSPDGKSIAFQRGTLRGDAFHWELFLVDAEGKNERQLTNNSWSSQVPSWSPDGKQLAIFADPAGRDQLFLLDLASGNPTPLAPSSAADHTPAFSPNGRAVAFVSTRDGGRDLYRVEVASGAVTRLTSALEVWSQPSWSPDGKRILFSAKRAETQDLYVIHADGSGLTRLTRGEEGVRP